MQISNNSVFLLSGRNEDTDRQHTGANAHTTDAKQSTEAILAESKRLIKSCLYKKAFNLVESFKAEAPYISPISNIKLCRRMVVCLDRICTRYLNKGDLHRVDHFIKLMNKSYEYLQIWHDLLCAYISRTNPKFKHLQKLLDEASELYEDTVDAEGIVRMKHTRNATQNSSFFSTNDSRETRPSSFMNKLKNSISATKENRPAYLEDMSNLEPDSRLVTETLTGQEINTTFHLDEFMKYYLTAIMTWVNFFKKVSKKYDSAYRFLLLGNKMAKELDSCLDPNLLHLVAEMRLALGTFYSEFGKHDEALKVFESAINVLQTEVSLRISRNQEFKDSGNYLLKLKETIRLLIITFINMSISYEQKDNYSRVLESLKMGSWFALKFLTNDDEASIMVKTHYSSAIQKFDRYLKELGEIERFAGNKTDIDVVEDTKQTTSSDHFARMNNHLYNKFNYDRLNASQYIVMTSPSNLGRDTTTRAGNRSEVFLDEKTEFGDPKNSWSRIRDMQSEGSIIRGGTIDDNDSPNGASIRKRSSATASKANVKDKKKSKLKLSLPPEEGLKTLTSDKYKWDGAFEKEKEEYEMDSDEERKHIEKLNRNIKDKKKLKEKKSKSNALDYLDVDDYFDKLVEKRIQEKEEDLKLHQPVGFQKIVKNYAFFLKSEKFDDVEFQFASRTLTAKARENLGDYTVSSKYKPPTFIAAQRNEVKIEAQHIEAKLDAENKINQRNASFKNLMQSKSPQAKTVKFATQNEDKEPKIATLVTIDEEKPPARTHKHTFSSILLKHKDNLGLNVVSSVLKDIEKQEVKEKIKMQEKNEMKNLGLIKIKSPKTMNIRESLLNTPNAGNKDVNPELMRKFSQTTKNTIQLLMENIEKKIDEDEDIKKRIEENKPLVDAQQPNNKFLKGLEELSKSTANISIKSDGKKIKNFTQVVKNMQLLAKKSVTIKTPKMSS